MWQKVLTIFQLILFLGVLISLGILFFIFPKQEVSAVEKRKLCPPPNFSINTLFQGELMDSLDLYLADNFPFREQFVQVSFQLKENRGIKNEEIAFYDQKVETNLPLREKITKISPLQDSLQTQTSTTNEPEEEATSSKGIMIYKGRGIQIFGGETYSAKPMAEVANHYQSTLKGKAQVYLAVTPTHVSFYLPKKYQNKPEKPNIDTLYAMLSKEVKQVKIYEVLEKHQKEYIFFNTDHHWTGLGAYYAYTAFCKEANLKPIPLQKMERKVIPNFLGSLYWLTRDANLKQNIDSVVYYKPSLQYNTFAYLAKNPTVPIPSIMLAEFAKGPDGYGVYFGADHPMVRIDTELKNERKALIIKNSYGNPFATYLVAHFEQIFVIDYRHFSGKIEEVVDKYGITDVILFHSTFSANTLTDAQQIKAILKSDS